MNHWIQALAAGSLVSLVSLSGAFTLWIDRRHLRRIVPLLVSLAVGVLLGDAFIHLIPDAIRQIGSLDRACMLVLAGIMLFFAIEKIVRNRHQHHILESPGVHAAAAGARMNLVGAAIHNFTDGVIIASSFLASPLLGVTTTAAIVAHEIPHEIGDVGALINGGYAPRRAVALNFLCALAVVAGVLATLNIGHWMAGTVPYLLPIAAGGFIYIAVADLIPSLHEHRGFGCSALQVAIMILGISCMLGVRSVEHFIGG